MNNPLINRLSSKKVIEENIITNMSNKTCKIRESEKQVVKTLLTGSHSLPILRRPIEKINTYHNVEEFLKLIKSNPSSYDRIYAVPNKIKGMVDSVYNLEIVTFLDRNQKIQVTISNESVIINANDEIQQISLDEWLHQKEIFDKLLKRKTFKLFLLFKNFKQWLAEIHQIKRERNQLLLSKHFLFVESLLKTSINQINRIVSSLRNLKNPFNESTVYEIETFKALFNKLISDYRGILETINEEIFRNVYGVCLIYVNEYTAAPNESFTKLEADNNLKKIRYLLKYIRYVDYMVQGRLYYAIKKFILNGIESIKGGIKSKSEGEISFSECTARFVQNIKILCVGDDPLKIIEYIRDFYRYIEEEFPSLKKSIPYNFVKQTNKKVFLYTERTRNPIFYINCKYINNEIIPSPNLMEIKEMITELFNDLFGLSNTVKYMSLDSRIRKLILKYQISSVRSSFGYGLYSLKQRLCDDIDVLKGINIINMEISQTEIQLKEFINKITVNFTFNVETNHKDIITSLFNSLLYMINFTNYIPIECVCIDLENFYCRHLQLIIEKITEFLDQLPIYTEKIGENIQSRQLEVKTNYFATCKSLEQCEKWIINNSLYLNESGDVKVIRDDIKTFLDLVKIMDILNIEKSISIENMEKGIEKELDFFIDSVRVHSNTAAGLILEFKKILDSEIQELKSNIKESLNDIKVYLEMNELSGDYDRNYVFLEKYNSYVPHWRSRVNYYQQLDILFGLYDRDYSEIYESIVYIENTYEVWKLFSEWRRDMKQFADRELVDIAYISIEGILDKYANGKEMIKNQEHFLIRELEIEISKYKEILNILMLLCGKALLKEFQNEIHEMIRIDENMPLTIEICVVKKNLFNLERIEFLCNYSDLQKKIGSRYKEIKLFWNQLKIRVELVKEFQILKIDDVLEILQDNILYLERISRKFNNKLIKTKKELDILTTFSKSFIYLTKVQSQILQLITKYENGDINDYINMQWVGLLDEWNRIISEYEKKKFYLNISEVVSLEFRLQKIETRVKNVDQVFKGYFSDLRLKFNRFILVSDYYLIKITNWNFIIENIQQYLLLLFPSIKSLNYTVFSEGKEVTFAINNEPKNLKCKKIVNGINTTSNFIFKFRNPINVSMVVEEFLKDIEHEITNTIIASIRDGLQEQFTIHNKNDLDVFIPQSLLIILWTDFSYKVASFLSDNNIQTKRKRIQLFQGILENNINLYVNILSSDINHQQRSITECIIINTKFHLLILKTLINKNDKNEVDLFMLAVPFYEFIDNNEYPITIKIGNNSLYYGFELSSLLPRQIVFSGSDYTLYSVLSVASQIGSCIIDIKNYSSVKEMNIYLGRYWKEYVCTSTVDFNVIEMLLYGTASLGGWLMLLNINELKTEILEYMSSLVILVNRKYSKQNQESSNIIKINRYLSPFYILSRNTCIEDLTNSKYVMRSLHITEIDPNFYINLYLNIYDFKFTRSRSIFQDFYIFLNNNQYKWIKCKANSKHFLKYFQMSRSFLIDLDDSTEECEYSAIIKSIYYISSNYLPQDEFNKLKLILNKYNIDKFDFIISLSELVTNTIKSKMKEDGQCIIDEQINCCSSLYSSIENNNTVLLIGNPKIGKSFIIKYIFDACNILSYLNKLNNEIPIYSAKKIVMF